MEEKPHELTIRVLNATPSSFTADGSSSSTPKASDGVWHTLKSSIAARELTSIARQAVSFTVSNVALTTGNSVSQERLEVALNAGGKLVAYGTALGTGNFAAAAIMAINDSVNIIMKQTQLNIKNNIERESLALSRDRAGIAFNYSRAGGAK